MIGLHWLIALSQRLRRNETRIRWWLWSDRVVFTSTAGAVPALGHPTLWQTASPIHSMMAAHQKSGQEQSRGLLSHCFTLPLATFHNPTPICHDFCAALDFSIFQDFQVLWNLSPSLRENKMPVAPTWPWHASRIESNRISATGSHWKCDLSVSQPISTPQAPCMRVASRTRDFGNVERLASWRHQINPKVVLFRNGSF